MLQHPVSQTRLPTQPYLEFDAYSQNLTLIEVYGCVAESQLSVISTLERMNRSTASRQGFIAAALLRSVTGCRVVNYQQWVSERKAQLGHKTSSYQRHRDELKELTTSEVTRMYDVVYSRHRVAGYRTVLESGPYIIVINDVLETVEQKSLTTLLLESYDFSLGPYHRSTDIHISWTGNSSLNFIQFDDLKTALYTLEQTLPELFQDTRLSPPDLLAKAGIHLYDLSQIVQKE